MLTSLFFLEQLGLSCHLLGRRKLKSRFGSKIRNLDWGVLNLRHLLDIHVEISRS